MVARHHHRPKTEKSPKTFQLLRQRESRKSPRGGPTLLLGLSLEYCTVITRRLLVRKGCLFSTGYTLTKEMSFREVCETVRDYAFVSSNLPLIVSLEVHTSPEQQEIMVELMTEYWKGMLVDLPLDPSIPSENLQLPTLKELENKILVKVKRIPHSAITPSSNPTTLQAPAQLSKTSTKESAQSDMTVSSGDDAPEQEPAPKPKVTEALAKLGVYFGGYSYKGLDKPGQCINFSRSRLRC